MAKKSSSSKSTKSTSKPDVRFIRLTNGEDLVSEVLDVSNGRMVINNPLKILYTPSLNSGYLTISLMQWIFTRVSRQQTFDMDLVNVLVMSPADDDLQNHYDMTVKGHQDRLTGTDEGDDSTEFNEVSEGEGIEMLKEVLNKLKNNKGGSVH